MPFWWIWPPFSDTSLQANAGPAQSGLRDVAVQLAGSASGGTPPYFYAWSLLSGPAGGTAVFSDENDPASTATFSGAGGDYRVLLTVVDDAGAVASSVVVVYVLQTPLELLGTDLWWWHQAGLSGLTEVAGEVTIFNDLSTYVRNLLKLDVPRVTKYDLLNGPLNGPRLYTEAAVNGCLVVPVVIPAATNLTIWGIIKATAFVSRVWTCSGSTNLDATGGRTGFASSPVGPDPAIRFYTFCAVGGQVGTDVVTTAGYHLASIVYEAGLKPQLYIDGVNVGEPAGADVGGVRNLAFVGFGSNASALNSDGSMFMGAVNTTAAERALVNQYVMEYWL